MPKTLFYPTQIKKLCQYLVQLAEVIPTSSGRSSYPPSALTRGRLAHFSEIGIYGGNSVNRTDPDWNIVKHRDSFTKIPFSLPCYHTSLRHFATLMAPFRLSIAGSRQFSLFLYSQPPKLTNSKNPHFYRGKPYVFLTSIQFKIPPIPHYSNN